MTTISNDSKRLLETVFRTAWDGAWVAWSGHMGGTRSRVAAPQATDDTYFSVAMIKPGATGRTIENAESVHALVIDDVGTKIDKDGMDMLAPGPDWVVESSAGNFQYGYVIEGGCSVAEFTSLRTAMKTHPVWGKADGADAVHLFRLPQGMNSKPAAGHFKPRLISLAAKNKHSTVSELAIAMSGPAAAGAPSPGAGASSPGVADEVTDDALLEKLVGLIPNDKSEREYWVSMAHAVWGASKGSRHGWDVFWNWCQNWKVGSDDPAADKKLWGSIQGSTIGRGWLIREAAARDQDGADKWRQAEAGSVFDDGVDHAAEIASAAAATGATTGGTITPFHRTVAQAVLLARGARMRFNHDSGCWHVFDGVIWEPQPASVKVGFMAAHDWVNQHILTMTPAEVKVTSKADFYSGVEMILRQRLPIRHAQFDMDPMLLGTPGGTVDLRTGVLRKAYPSEYISKTVAVAPTSVARCPQWRKFIAEITKGDAGAMVFLQQWAGYCLTGDTTEQMFLFLYGPGGNGKSVLMDTLSRLMGTYFVKPVADMYFAKGGQRHMQEVAMLAGARLITVSEVPANASWDEGKLKDHTGGGAVTANFMRQNSFSFVPQFKITALGNHQPTFPGGMNDAIKRRFKLMLLDFVPNVPDKGLMAKLWSEAPEILRWCLDGLAGPQGWHATGLIVPAVIDAATDAFVHDQDVFGLWLEDRVENVKGVRANSTDLFNDWMDFRSRNQGGEVFGNPTAFSTEMTRRGYQKQRSSSGKGFSDIRLKSKAKTVF